MCNLYRMEKAPDAIAALARELGQGVLFPDGVPNAEPRDIHITDRAPLLRAAAGGGVEWVERRWSWPHATGKPIFNLKSEGRSFPPPSRCIALADGFYEFFKPVDLKAKRKDRWLFTWPEQPWFGIAAIWRAHPAVGEAFTLLTCAPGPDVAPLHHRQIVVLSPEDCFRWLAAPDAQPFLRPPPAGSLRYDPA